MTAAILSMKKERPALGMFNPYEEVSTGTSILAFKYDKGVVIGADSRTSAGTFITNRVSDKLTQVTKHIYCCRSGSAADTQAIADIVKYHLEFYKMEMGEEPTVLTAANLFKELCYTYRDQLTAGIIVAGWDKYDGAQCFSIPVGGMINKMPVIMGGSGSTYVYGYLDAHYKENMPLQDAKEFAINILSLAMHRDGSSGGVIRLAVIEEDKPIAVERISGEKLPNW